MDDLVVHSRSRVVDAKLERPRKVGAEHEGSRRRGREGVDEELVEADDAGLGREEKPALVRDLLQGRTVLGLHDGEYASRERAGEAGEAELAEEEEADRRNLLGGADDGFDELRMGVDRHLHGHLTADGGGGRGSAE